MTQRIIDCENKIRALHMDLQSISCSFSGNEDAMNNLTEQIESEIRKAEHELEEAIAEVAVAS